MFQAKVTQKIKTNILGSITFFFDNRAVYEIMGKSIGIRQNAGGPGYIIHNFIMFLSKILLLFSVMLVMTRATRQKGD